MKIKISGWITPDGYTGTVREGECPSSALKVDLEVETDEIRHEVNPWPDTPDGLPVPEPARCQSWGQAFDMLVNARKLMNQLLEKELRSVVVVYGGHAQEKVLGAVSSLEHLLRNIG